MVIYQAQDTLIFFQLNGIISEVVASKVGQSATKMCRNKIAILKKLLSIFLRKPWTTCCSFVRTLFSLKNLLNTCIHKAYMNLLTYEILFMQRNRTMMTLLFPRYFSHVLHPSKHTIFLHNLILILLIRPIKEPSPWSFVFNVTSDPVYF